MMDGCLRTVCSFAEFLKTGWLSLYDFPNKREFLSRFLQDERLPGKSVAKSAETLKPISKVDSCQVIATQLFFSAGRFAQRFFRLLQQGRLSCNHFPKSKFFQSFAV